MKREIALQRDWGAIFFAKNCIYAFFFVPLRAKYIIDGIKKYEKD